MMKGINQELFGTDSTKTISKENFMAGFIAGTLKRRRNDYGKQLKNILVQLWKLSKQKLWKKNMLTIKLKTKNSLLKTD